MTENRLARESSPYLRQHRHNPVDWYPWGPEALEKAQRENKPILLSVGYSACHWCHVMERESFEDVGTAELMNRLYVCIKVDREERPDVDNIYQTAVQLLRQSGGWPLTAFLLPDGRPYYAGTYFPNEARYGMPAFKDVLGGVENAFRTRAEEVERAAQSIVAGLKRVQDPGRGRAIPAAETVADAAAWLGERIDRQHGGFGGAPKFPSCSNLWALWRGDASCRAGVLLTLRKMADGGIHDQVGGGFHRYSTDAEWLAPHFEKMLYDNAQLVPLYLAAWRETGESAFRDVAERTLAYLVAEMRTGDGLFYAATDADSEGVEGKFFVWTPAEVIAAAGEEAGEAFCRFYDVTAGGNWEGHSIPRILADRPTVAGKMGIAPEGLSARLTVAREKLYATRATRVPPARDDKVLVSWNAMTIVAFGEAWSATGEGRWLDVATRCTDTILSRLVRNAVLQHSVCGDDVRGPGFLDDHAAFGEALVRVYEATGSSRYLDAALAVAMALEADFADRERGGWYQTPEGGETLIHRPKDAHDSAVPSGSAMAASFLQRLHVHTEEARWLNLAEGTLRAHADQLEGNPGGSGHLLGVLDVYHRGWEEVIIGGTGEGRAALERAAREAPGLDRIVLALEGLPASHPAAGGRGAVEPTAWVCRGRTCSLPIRTVEGLRGVLRG